MMGLKIKDKVDTRTILFQTYHSQNSDLEPCHKAVWVLSTTPNEEENQESVVSTRLFCRFDFGFRVSFFRSGVFLIASTGGVLFSPPPLVGGSGFCGVFDPKVNSFTCFLDASNALRSFIIFGISGGVF